MNKWRGRTTLRSCFFQPEQSHPRQLTTAVGLCLLFASLPLTAVSLPPMVVSLPLTVLRPECNSLDVSLPSHLYATRISEDQDWYHVVHCYFLFFFLCYDPFTPLAIVEVVHMYVGLTTDITTSTPTTIITSTSSSHVLSHHRHRHFQNCR